MKLNSKLLLGAIVLLAAVLRLWNLGSVPPSLDWDEVSWGYNAYSILTTGKDEFGKTLPVVIRSLDDYKPALYAYLDLIPIALLGLTDFAVRLPNAIFGVLTALTTYFLVFELFKRKDIALLSSFLMAISPWSIQFSRYYHEGIVGLEFNLLMILFFIKGLKKPAYLSLAALFASLSLYSYQNEKLIVPLLGLVLLGIFWKEFIKIPKKYIGAAFLTGLILTLPILVFTLTTPESFTRAKGASFLRNPKSVLNLQYYPRRLLEDKEAGNFVGLVIDNRRVVYVKGIVGNYLSHFDPNFLFVKGEIIPRHQPPGMGHLYLLELPFFLIGLYAFFFGKFDRRVKKLILFWMLIVPIPAAFTWDVPNAGRTINFLPTFQIIISIGLISSYFFLRNINKYLAIGAFSFIALLGIFNFTYYLNQYFVQHPYYDSQAYQYGYAEIIPLVKGKYPEYKNIVIDTEVPFDQSYIFFLYHLKFPPQEYQKHSSSGEYMSRHNFDKYIFLRFMKEDWEKIEGPKLVIAPKEFDNRENLKIIKRIYFRDGSLMGIIAESK